MENTILEIGDKTVDYYKKAALTNVETRGYLIYILCIIFLTISVLIFILQCIRWEPLVQLQKLKRIKKNVQSWIGIINERTGIEMARGRTAAMQVQPEAFDMQCYDLGNVFVAMRLNSSTYLPEFIRRGTGDVWRFRKAAEIDTSAEQFCMYNIFVGNQDILTCGIDMFNKLGYSGYFETNHACINALTNIVSNN